MVSAKMSGFMAALVVSAATVAVADSTEIDRLVMSHQGGSMSQMGSRVSWHSTFGKEVLIGIALVVGVMVYSLVRFPASVADAGARSAFGTFVALLVYAAGAEWARRTAHEESQIALSVGAKVGLLVGAAASLNHLLEVFEVFVGLRPSLAAIFGMTMWAWMFLWFGVASAATYQQVGSMRLGIVSSVWSAVISTVVTIIFALSVGLLFLPRMQRVLAEPFAASGMRDPRAFVIRHMFDAMLSHLLIAPVVAGTVGVTSVVACVMLWSVPRQSAVILSVGGLLLFLAGVGAILYASSLARAARPPFILFGLGALAVTLASAYPLLWAIRYPNHR